MPWERSQVGGACLQFHYCLHCLLQGGCQAGQDEGGGEVTRGGNLQADAWAGPVDTPLLQLIRGATRSRSRSRRSRIRRHQLSRAGVRLDLSCDIVDASHVPLPCSGLPAVSTSTSFHFQLSFVRHFRYNGGHNGGGKRAALHVVCWRRFAFRRN